jgi:PleD family two-component response regulator
LDAALDYLTGIAQPTIFRWSDQMSQSDCKIILIVDDTPTNIGIISSVLKDSNGEKALVLTSACDRPELILLDITLPGMGGPVRYVRGEGQFRGPRNSYDLSRCQNRGR